jgi:hypothetical protein
MMQPQMKQSGTARSGKQVGQVMSVKREMSLPGNTVLRNCMEIHVVWAVAPNFIVHDNGQYGSSTLLASWFLNFRCCQVFLVHLSAYQ